MKILHHIGLILLTICFISTVPSNAQSSNNLSVGKLATKHSNVSFSPNGLRNFNGFKKSEILALRTNCVHEHPELVSGTYVPADSVFGQITDGRPWWGLQGVSFYGSGPKSSLGDSWHSQQICNPFILVVADIYPSLYHCDPSRFGSLEDFSAAGCPTRCQPKSVSINPDKSQGGVTYDVTQYLQQANTVNVPPINANEIVFGLEACNARDFGYNYLYVDTSQSTNIVCSGKQSPVHLVQFFHCGNSCGIPGGCNNISPTIEALENFKLTTLPARCHIILWKNNPGSSVEKPDFTFDIDFN